MAPSMRRVAAGLVFVALLAAWLTSPLRDADAVSPTVQPQVMVVSGAGAGGGPDIREFGADGSLHSEFFAYDPAFLGGVRVATGHLNCDGSEQIITGAGPGGGPHVRAFNADGSPYVGLNRTTATSFFAYEATYAGGVSVAAGDLNGSGCDSIITGTGPNSRPVVRVFNNDGSDSGLSFLAYDETFSGGVWVATGDVDGDGHDEIITGAGPSGGPHVRVWKYVNGAIVPVGPGFFAYEPGFTGGVRVATASQGSGRAAILAAAGASSPPRVRLFNGDGTAAGSESMPYVQGFLGGLFIGGDGNHMRSVPTGPTSSVGVDWLDVYATGPGSGGGPNVRAFEGLGAISDGSWFAYDERFRGGVFVAVGDFGPATTTTTTSTTLGPTSSSGPTTSGSTTTTIHRRRR